jgi:hypothetical protein
MIDINAGRSSSVWGPLGSKRQKSSFGVLHFSMLDTARFNRAETSLFDRRKCLINPSRHSRVICLQNGREVGRMPQVDGWIIHDGTCFRRVGKTSYESVRIKTVPKDTGTLDSMSRWTWTQRP